jgi:protein gp37/ParB-like chromosome segregation protein Spo0J
MKTLPLASLHAHPRNPRLAPREDVIARLAALIGAAGALDEAHALLVRPNADGHEIVSGHHRKLAAERAGLAEVPCHVRAMADDEAYMELLVCNTQGELTGLEEGRHALHSGMDLKAYAEKIGVPVETARSRLWAAKVAEACMDVHDITDLDCHLLAAIHPAPPAEWSGLASRALAEGWTVERARSEARKLTARHREQSARARAATIPAGPAELSHAIGLEQWHKLDKRTRDRLLDLGDDAATGGFNKQGNDAIEWARWSWNPVTGCLHDCPYCYARDIALSRKMATAYPYGFAPTLKPGALMAARGRQPPGDATFDERFRNVFTCSMADLFGRWVPPEWVEAVLREVRAAPAWNFLCLTKFPKRMAEFPIPPNTWMGTTVDLQARVAAAEAGFERVEAAVRWLSCEPLLEPLRFKRMGLFHWLVIGGASASTATPEWRPPFAWVHDLVRQARDAGVRVYFKTNLLGSPVRILELPNDLPVPKEEAGLPEVFRYLGAGMARDAA